MEGNRQSPAAVSLLLLNLNHVNHLVLLCVCVLSSTSICLFMWWLKCPVQLGLWTLFSDVQISELEDKYIEMLSSQNACCMLTKYKLSTETDCIFLKYQSIFILFLRGDHKLKYYFVNHTYIPRIRAGMPLYVSLPNGLISNPPIKWKSEMPPSWHLNSDGAGHSGQVGGGQRSSRSTGLGGSFPYVTSPGPLICTVGGVASLGSISVEENISNIIFWWNTTYHHVVL